MRGLLSNVLILSLLGVPAASAQTPEGALRPPSPRCGTEMFPGFPGWVVRPARPGDLRTRSDGCRVHPETVPLPPYAVPGGPPPPGADRLPAVEGSGR